MNEFENGLNNDNNIQNENADLSLQYNPVVYSPITPDDSVKKRSTGIKVFAIIMAFILVLTTLTCAGYLYGRSSVLGKSSKKAKLNLDARPKNDDQYTAAQIYDMLNESVVGIRVYNGDNKIADATGVFYSDNGYIVTNDHIYANIPNARFRIYLHDGTEYNANFVAGDSISDLAILEIQSDKKFKVPSFGDSTDIVCGENVVAIGRPSDATDASSITSGIISLPKRRMRTTSNYTMSLIQTDSAINPGSSGGVLVNMYGQVIGITASKLAGEEYDSVGFAIPTTTLKRVAEQLIKYGKVKDRAKLGITYQEVTSVIAQMGGYDYTGLYVDDVSSDSDIYGKVVKGDTITHINGIEITHDDIVLDLLEESYAGDIVKLTVVSKNGSVKTYEVKLKANIGESSYVTQ